MDENRSLFDENELQMMETFLRAGGEVDQVLALVNERRAQREAQNA